MRVGIITVLDQTNYGNRLQNLAMQELLKDLGCQAETIRFDPGEKLPLKGRLRQVTPLRKLNWACRRLLGIDPLDEQLKKRRWEAVNDFNRRHLSMSRRLILADRVPAALCRGCQWFVTGSDQVWNPHFMGGAAPIPYVAYLRFAPGDKRLAISPSFGVADLPEKEAETTARYLKEFHFLSAREEDGQALIKRLTGRDCPVIPDPTLLVNPALWERLLEGKTPPRTGGYVLTYFLGRVSPQRRAFIQRYAAEAGVEVLWMNDLAFPDSYVWGPLEFLNAIRHCSAFFTDSFHGCVFSVVFRRQFYVLKREDDTADMSGRIVTLLGMAGLEERVVTAGEPLPPAITAEDFDRVCRMLARRRGECTELLKNVLEGLA